MKLYLAGPMTGYDLFNFPKFFEVEDKLLDLDYEVISPARLSIATWIKAGVITCFDEWVIGCQLEKEKPAVPLSKYMKNDYKALSEADAVVFLPAWERSSGANKELKAAQDMGLKLYEWKEVEKTAFGGSYWSECLQPLEIKGLKFDGAKRQWNLLYRPWLRGVVDVLTRGALKYSPDNWKRVDNPKVSYLNALQRHLDAFIEGEEKDPETGISHLSHLGCCLMFLKYFEDNQKCETAEEILAREG